MSCVVRIISPLVLAVLLLSAAVSRPAMAHAILVRSTPVEGATVAPGAVDILLTFNSRIDSSRSRLTLTGPDGTATVLPLGAPAVDQLNGHASLTQGAWVLRWQVLAVDGHITRGDVRFKVGLPTAEAP